jgi:hypothetical protein
MQVGILVLYIGTCPLVTKHGWEISDKWRFILALTIIKEFPGDFPAMLLVGG